MNDILDPCILETLPTEFSLAYPFWKYRLDYHRTAARLGCLLRLGRPESTTAVHG